MKKSKLFLALAALMFTACPTGNDDDGGGGPTTPPNTVLPTPNASSQVSITGSTTYYYDSSYDSLKGVFIPGRTVTLNPFYIAKYETTYELWYEVYQWATDASRSADIYTFANPGREGNDGTDGAEPTEAKNEPVTNISWRDAVVWCNAYSEKSGKEPVYRNVSDDVLRNSTASVESLIDLTKWEGKDGYRLPTEAEWEYAARGGGTPSTTGPFVYRWAGTNDESQLENYAWYSSNSGNTTHPVGGKMANSLGLFDMSGNVYEWCWDWYGSVDGSTPATGSGSGASRVYRGGGWDWYINTSNCAVAYRTDYTPDNRDDNLGFRLVLCP